MLQRSEVRRIDIFRGLSKDDMTELLRWMDSIELKKNKILFTEGQRPDGLYALFEGEVAVVKKAPRGRIRLSVLEAPTFFGEISLLIDAKRSTGIRTLTPVRLGFLHKDIFLRQIERRKPTALVIAANIGKLLSQRLKETNEQMEILTSRERALEQGRRYREANA